MAFHCYRHYLVIMKIKHIFMTALLFSIALSAVSTQETAPQVLTVDEAVRIALDNNLSLRRTAIDLGTRKRTADRSWNSVLPSLNAQALVSHPASVTGPIQPAPSMGPAGITYIDRDVWTPGFSLSAGITLSTAVIENINRAQADYEAGLLSYEAARQELELQVRKLFYQILLLDANCELVAQNFQSAQIRYEQTVTRSRTGQAPLLDELSARVDMENIRPTMINAGILYENALDSFKMILGIPAETAIIPEGDLAIAGNISTPATETGESLDASRLLQSIRAMEAQRNSIRNSAYVPNLRLSWTSMPMYNIQNKQWSDNGSFSISLGLSLDSYLPWSNAKTQIDTLNDNIRTAEIQLTEIIRNRENRINQNVRTIERIMESLEAMKLNVELAQNTYTMIEDSYRRGAADYQRLQGATDSLAQTKNRLLQEQYNLISALLDLEKELNIPFGTFSK